MANDQWLPQPYSEQELLSFERLKRAVMSRVLDRAEILLEDEFPLSPDRTTELTREEWERAKDAVREPSPLCLSDTPHRQPGRHTASILRQW